MKYEIQKFTKPDLIEAYAKKLKYGETDHGFFHIDDVECKIASEDEAKICPTCPLEEICVGHVYRQKYKRKNKNLARILRPHFTKN